MTIIKILKVALPFATATSATIATTLLVSSFNKKDENLKREDSDNPLNDLKLPDENYEDTKKFYAKDGTGDGQIPLNEETVKKIADLLDKAGDLKDPSNFAERMQNLEKEMDKLFSSKESNSRSGVSDEESDDGEELDNDLEQTPSSTGLEQQNEDVITLPKAQDEAVGSEEAGLPLTQKATEEEVELQKTTSKLEAEKSGQQDVTPKNDSDSSSVHDGAEETAELAEQRDAHDVAGTKSDEIEKGDEQVIQKTEIDSEPQQNNTEDGAQEEGKGGQKEQSGGEGLDTGNQGNLNEEAIKRWQDWENKLFSATESLSRFITD